MRVRALTPIVLILTMVTVAMGGKPQSVNVVTVSQSGIEGGGFQNVITKNPGTGVQFISGGDTSGFHTTSVNNGDVWVTSNTGLNDAFQDTITAIAFRQPPNATQVFAAFGVGNTGNSGLLKSTNSGATWVKQTPAGSVLPVFQGHTPGEGAAYQVGAAPRATGKLLALDEPGGTLTHIYAGTFGDGVMRFDISTNQWTRIALGTEGGNPNCNFTTDTGTYHGCFITSLQLSPLGETDTLYVSVHGGDPSKCIGNLVCGGVFKITSAACTGEGCADTTTTRIPTISGPVPVNAEELTFQSTSLFCACGPDGFYKKAPADTGLIRRNGGVNNLDFDVVKGTYVSTVTATTGLVIVGMYNGKCETVGGRESCHNLYRSTDAGLNWFDLTYQIPLGNINTNIAGSGIAWWLRFKTPNLIDGAAYNVASLGFASDATLLVAGHSGVWKSTNNTTYDAWQIAVQGMGATSNKDVAADPSSGTASYAYVGDTDWTVLASFNNLIAGSINQTEPPGGQNKTGFALAIDRQDSTTPTDTYLAAGNAGSEDMGDIYYNPDPTTQPWTPKVFVTDGSCDRLNPRLIGVGVGRPSGAPSATLYAATDGCGFYRLLPGGSWTRVDGTAQMFRIKDAGFTYAPISYPSNVGTVLYVMDRNGPMGNVWRSEDSGATWSAPIFFIPQNEQTSSTGFMVADPNASISTLWVSTKNIAGLHKLTCSSSCQTLANWIDTPFPAMPNPGPIALVPCTAPCTSVVYVATRVVAGSPLARLYKSTPSGGFCQVPTSSFYQAAVTSPVQLAVSRSMSGTVKAYVATAGQGTIVVSDNSTATCT